MKLEKAIDLYIKARKGVISPDTVKWYEAKLRRLLGHLGDVGIDSITTEDLNDWRASLFSRHLSEQTIDGYVRAVRTFFKWLKQKKRIEVDPADELERPALPDIPPKRISRDSIVALLRAAMGAGRVDLARDHGFADIRDYALIRFFVMTGARQGGVVGLRLGDLNLGDCSALVHEKGSKTRVIYFDPDTAEALQLYVEVRPPVSHDWLWVTHRGVRLTASGTRQVLRRVAQRAGLPDVGTHRLRHTFAFESITNRVDPEILRRQLGHAQLTTTYRNYIRWSNDHQKRAFETPWLGDLFDPANTPAPKLRLVKKPQVG